MSLLTYLKLGGAAVALVAIFSFGLYFRHLQSEAAKVPALEQTVKTQNDRATALAAKIAAADAARQAADTALSQWQDIKNATVDAVKKEGRRAAAATNPACAPSDADRKLRGDALRSLLRTGQGGEARGVPSAPNPPH